MKKTHILLFYTHFMLTKVYQQVKCYSNSIRKIPHILNFRIKLSFSFTFVPVFLNYFQWFVCVIFTYSSCAVSIEIKFTQRTESKVCNIEGNAGGHELLW